MVEIPTARRCKVIRLDGSPCRGWANESGFCLAHDPARAGVIAEARRAGGKARQGRKIGPVGEAAPVKLATLADVLGVVEAAVNDVLRLENSISRARCLGYLAGVWSECYETSELERRLAALEKRLGEDAL